MRTPEFDKKWAGLGLSESAQATSSFPRASNLQETRLYAKVWRARRAYEDAMVDFRFHFEHLRDEAFRSGNLVEARKQVERCPEPEIREFLMLQVKAYEEGTLTLTKSDGVS